MAFETTIFPQFALQYLEITLDYENQKWLRNTTSAHNNWDVKLRIMLKIHIFCQPKKSMCVNSIINSQNVSIDDRALQ